MPIVVLCVLWPMLTRIDRRTAEIEKRVDEQADVIEQVIVNEVGQEKWQKIKSRLGR
jgi:uncharacterized coiled-coil protein SlyX